MQLQDQRSTQYPGDTPAQIRGTNFLYSLRIKHLLNRTACGNPRHSLMQTATKLIEKGFGRL